MKKVFNILAIIFLIMLILALSSCERNSEQDLINDEFPKERAEIHECIKSIVKDAETTNIEGLKAAHLFSEKFTKFGPRNFDRQNVASANNSEEAFFGSITNYNQEIKDLKIDVFGDIGIATYYPYVSFVQDGEAKSGNGRQTLVFLKTENGWKIVHEHGTPSK